MSDINLNSGGFDFDGVYAPDEKDWFSNVVFSTAFHLCIASGIGFAKAKEQMEKANERMQAIGFPWTIDQEVNPDEV